MKPVIGVLPSIDTERNRIWVHTDYMTALSESGARPVLVFPEDIERDAAELLGVCDGLLLTGGGDINPVLYGETDKDGLSDYNDRRDAVEQACLKEALRKKMPVFGICRGAQLINVVLGGTLYQDLPLQKPSAVNHYQSLTDPGTIHAVNVREATGLHRLIGKERIEVNSFHHQGVKTLAGGLLCTAVADDGLCEGFEKTGYPFLWAVQWHPERIFCTDETSRALFLRFTEEAQRFASFHNHS